VRDSFDLLHRLDAETAADQRSADESWLAVARAEGSVPTYMRLLGRVYGFEAPLEAALAYTPLVGALVDLRARSRSGLIAQDLLALGVTAGQVATLDEHAIFPFGNLADAFGWLYVSERSTRVHARVRDELVTRHPQLQRATAYLAASCGNAAVARWRQLGVTLDRVAHAPRVADHVLAAVREAYRAQADWVTATVTPRTWPASCANPRG
jgi:heme oxygenase